MPISASWLADIEARLTQLEKAPALAEAAEDLWVIFPDGTRRHLGDDGR